MIAIADRWAADRMYTNIHAVGNIRVSWSCHEHQRGTSCGATALSAAPAYPSVSACILDRNPADLRTLVHDESTTHSKELASFAECKMMVASIW